MIKQVAGGWRLYSHADRPITPVTSYSECVKREQEIKSFKHIKRNQ